MDARAIGLVRPVEDVKIAQLVLFQYRNRLEPGIIVNYLHDKRGILHIEGSYNDKIMPEIYKQEDFHNESVLHIENARIVPLLQPDQCGIGAFGNGLPSRALHMDGDAVYLYAKYEHSVIAINLFTGKKASIYTNDLFYTRSWIIETPCSEVDFEPYLQFKETHSK